MQLEPLLDVQCAGLHEQLEQAGVKHVYFEAPGTAHEFQTWRKSLHEFAQLLWK